jgi:hypothetical protein
MTLVGLIYSSPLLFAALVLMNGDPISFWMVALSVPSCLVGIPLLLNVVESLGLSRPDDREDDGSPFF